VNIRRKLAERFRSWKEIFWKKTVGLIGGLWVALGAWDLVKSELLPKKYESWTVVEKTPHMTWSTWVIVLLGILLIVLLEGAHAAIEKRDSALNTAASSKTTMNRDWPGDWKLTEDGFRRHEKSYVRADWFSEPSYQTQKWTITGDTADRVHDCEALCIQAGKLLAVSPTSLHLSGVLKSEKNDADRWLNFLKDRYGLQETMFTTSVRDGQTHTASAGSIRNLAVTSARACIECGAKSFAS